MLFSNSKVYDRNADNGVHRIRPRRLTFKNFDENTKEYLAFPSPINKSPRYPKVIMEQSDLGFCDKEIDLNLIEEQIFKDSFPNSPFIKSKQTPFFEKKFSMLMNQCHTPKKSIQAENSIMGQQTPINAMNRYSMGIEHAPSPIRFMKADHKLGMFAKSICETPENLKMRKGFREIDLQKFLNLGNELVDRGLISSNKMKQKFVNSKKKPNFHELSFNTDVGNILTRDNKENESQKENSGSKVYRKIRSNMIQYDSDFMKMNDNKISKNPFMMKKSGNNQVGRVLNANIYNNITSFQGELNVIKPKNLFDSKKSINQTLEKKVINESIKDFIEKGYSKIMERTPQNSQKSGGLGVLFANAMNTMKYDSQVKQNQVNKYTSGDSIVMNNYYEKKSIFAESKVKIIICFMVN